MNSRILVLCCFRDAAEYLPEFISHLRDHVQGFLFLDDRSNKAQAEFSRKLIGDEPLALGLINRAGRTSAPFQFEYRNRSILLREALAEGASHVLTLDADERLGKPLLHGLRGYCKELQDTGYESLSVSLRDVWNSEDKYRTDSIWSQKRKQILFALDEFIIDAIPKEEGLHKPWLEIDASDVLTDYENELEMFHLGSLSPDLRAARVARHEQADPEHKYQADYKYLADEAGLVLETISKQRNWK